MTDLRQPFALLASVRRGLEAVQWLREHNLPVPQEHVELVALIAGERRIAAFRKLGRSHIPVTVIDIEAIARGERDENVCRKDFAPTEAYEIRRPSRRKRQGWPRCG